MTVNLPSPMGLFSGNEAQQNWLYLIYRKLTEDLKTKTFTTFTPTLTGNGSMTVYSQVTTIAHYMVIGGLVYIELNVTFTIGKTPNTDIQFSVPLAPTYSGGVPCVITDSSKILGFLSYTASSTSVSVKRHDSGNWSAGSSRNISLSFIYSTTTSY